jgi:hypothetical protein
MYMTRGGNGLRRVSRLCINDVLGAQIVLWIATMLVVLLATFPYYVNFLV